MDLLEQEDLEQEIIIIDHQMILIEEEIGVFLKEIQLEGGPEEELWIEGMVLEVKEDIEIIIK